MRYKFKFPGLLPSARNPSAHLEQMASLQILQNTFDEYGIDMNIWVVQEVGKNVSSTNFVSPHIWGLATGQEGRGEEGRRGGEGQPS